MGDKVVAIIVDLDQSVFEIFTILFGSPDYSVSPSWISIFVICPLFIVNLVSWSKVFNLSFSEIIEPSIAMFILTEVINSQLVKLRKLPIQRIFHVLFGAV